MRCWSVVIVILSSISYEYAREECIEQEPALVLRLLRRRRRVIRSLVDGRGAGVGERGRGDVAQKGQQRVLALLSLPAARDVSVRRRGRVRIRTGRVRLEQVVVPSRVILI